MKNKVFFVDFNGTISNSFFWEHLRTSKNPADVSLYEKWSKALFLHNSKDYINRWMSGEFTSEDVIKTVAKATNSTFKTVMAEFIKGCESMEYVSEKIPALLTKVRESGGFTCIATNNMDCFTRWTVKSMKLNEYFDHIISSFDTKGLKNAVDSKGKSVFFSKFFDTYDFKPSDCIFIDDSEDKNGYIQSLGIKYIRLDNKLDLAAVLEKYLSLDSTLE